MIYSSPASELINTIAVAAALATEAPVDVESVFERVKVVPSAAALTFSASYGATKYGKSAVPEPQPYMSQLDSFLSESTTVTHREKKTV